MKADSVLYSSEYRIKKGYEWMSYILQFHNGEVERKSLDIPDQNT